VKGKFGGYFVRLSLWQFWQGGISENVPQPTQRVVAADERLGQTEIYKHDAFDGAETAANSTILTSL
jgi:hypothetical protein